MAPTVETAAAAMETAAMEAAAMEAATTKAAVEMIEGVHLDVIIPI